jgi:hypothetical protein
METIPDYLRFLPKLKAMCWQCGSADFTVGSRIIVQNSVGVGERRAHKMWAAEKTRAINSISNSDYLSVGQEGATLSHNKLQSVGGGGIFSGGKAAGI